VNGKNSHSLFEALRRSHREATQSLRPWIVIDQPKHRRGVGLANRYWPSSSDRAAVVYVIGQTGRICRSVAAQRTVVKAVWFRYLPIAIDRLAIRVDCDQPVIGYRLRRGWRCRWVAP